MDPTIRLAAQRVNAWHMARVLVAAESHGLQAAASASDEQETAQQAAESGGSAQTRQISDSSSSARA